MRIPTDPGRARSAPFLARAAAPPPSSTLSPAESVAMAPSVQRPAPPKSQQSLPLVTAPTRPRTVTAQGEALVLQPPHQQGYASSRGHGHGHGHRHPSHTVQQPLPPRDQVVVGIAAYLGDDVEDWSDDFVEHTPRARRAPSDGSAFGPSERGSEGGEPLPRALRSFPRSSGLFPRTSMGRRSWNSQRSCESGGSDRGEGSTRTSRIRRSAHELRTPEEEKEAPVVPTVVSESVVEAAIGASSEEAALCKDAIEPSLSAQRSDTVVDDLSGFVDVPAPIRSKRRRSVEKNTLLTTATEKEDTDKDDEDWDVEFGFADGPEDDQDDRVTGGAVDANRRRTDNFNIFLRGFHDMMAGDEFLDDDDDDATRSSKLRKSTEEQLFRRRRSEFYSTPSIDGSIEGATRTSLTSLPGSTEYSLVDKYRLLDIASSSAYAVRIERYPQPCVTHSRLEKLSDKFQMFTDNKLEHWLANVAQTKCDTIRDLMVKEQPSTPNPRQQKNHQFRTLVSLPFGKEFTCKCFKQIAIYHFYGEEKSNKELVRVFFEKLATAGIADDKWSSGLPSADIGQVADMVMEVLQEAARLYGPVRASGAVPSSASSEKTATTFWMRQFQTILTICMDAFPDYRHFIALVELRFVCHHLVGLSNSDLSYTWQVANTYESFSTSSPIAGQSAPIIANEILQFYGNLLAALNVEDLTPVSSSAVKGNAANPEPRRCSQFCVSRDIVCIRALALCDIQSIYDSRSALAETSIPELIELFEFDDEDVTFHGHIDFTGVAGMPDSASIIDEAKTLALLGPSSVERRCELMNRLYARIELNEYPLIKAKCAAVVSNTSVGVAIAGSTSSANLKVAESFGFEALRILEWMTCMRLSQLDLGVQRGNDPVSSMFSSDGLLSGLGREVLEGIGNVLIKNQKYRYGILCLEAAAVVFSFLNQGKCHDRLERLMCTLTNQADDVKRALPLHQKVAASCLRQGNVNEYMFLTQALTKLWIREGKFSQAENYLSASSHFLRNQTNLLPPFFLSSMAGSYSNSEATSLSGRSGTMLTTSSTASSSASGSFVGSARVNTSELDLWLKHDIALHLLLRDIYQASGRFIESTRVLEYVLDYSTRLPRGKRTQLRMLLVEDSLQLCMFDTSRYMVHLLDQEANYFCDRLLQRTGVGGVGSSSGGFGSSSGGGSSNGGRSMGGMGSEARFSFDMVLSNRYILCRAKLHLSTGELEYAYAWLSLAQIKNERDSVRNQAKLYTLDGRVFLEMLRRQHEQRLFPEKRPSKQVSRTVDEVLQMFSTSMYALSKSEQRVMRQRMIAFYEAVDNPGKTLELGIQAYWKSYDQYEVLEDGHHQLKALLDVVTLQLAPIERSFFALGSSMNDDQLLTLLGTCTVTRPSSASIGMSDISSGNGDIRDETEPIANVRTTLVETQRLLRRALRLSEQTAEPKCYFRTLVHCAQVWTWMERLAPYKSERQVKEGTAFWDEAVKVLKAVFLRRVSFEDKVSSERFKFSGPGRVGGRAQPSSTFSLVPILNFRERTIAALESSTLQLIAVACQLQHFERVPEYVEELLLTHLDELLSARLCLNSISHQLRSFRSQHSIARHIPLHSVPGPSVVSAAKPIVDVGSRPSFTSSSGPGIGLPTGGSAGSLVGASGTKRKGHKKNQSMSSISELLASSTNGASSSSSFHDLSSSFISSRGTVLSVGTTPRTGLASLSDRSFGPPSKPATVSATTNSSFSGSTNRKDTNQPTPSDDCDEVERTRGRSRSAPITPVGQGAPATDTNQTPSEVERVNEASISNSAQQGHSVRVINLKDVHPGVSGDTIEQSALRMSGVPIDSDRFTNDGTSSSGANVGLYDFDDFQSERLWWMFNSWRESKANYVNGKIEISGYRHQNLKALRQLVDAFDPQQVAVVYSAGAASTKHGDLSAGRMLSFDVAHINTHALVEDRGFVLSIGYDASSQRRLSSRHSRLAFKVFKVLPERTATWRMEIPRADWYLSRHEYAYGSFNAATDLGSSALLRLLIHLGPKLLLKLIGILLLENSLVVVGSSFPQVKEVSLCLLHLLHPFRWQHTFLPFLPVTSWRFLADSLNHTIHTQLTGRNKSKRSLSLRPDWRWGSPRSARSVSGSVGSAGSTENGDLDAEGSDVGRNMNVDAPPFLIGTTSDTWYGSLKTLQTLNVDERVVPTLVNVLNLDDLASFSTAKNSSSAVSWPRKWRKQFMERFEKVIKQRRKAQEKMGRRLERQASTSSTTSAFSVQSPASAYSHSHSHQSLSYSDAPRSRSRRAMTSGTGRSERAQYDADTAAGFVSALHELYDRLAALGAERAKKLSGRKKNSKRHEIKAWFSSSHDFDAFVEKFVETALYERYALDKMHQSASASSELASMGLHRSSGTNSTWTAMSTRAPSAASATPMGSLMHTRSFDSVSSTASSQHQL